jgi:hypothetical protein
MKPFPICLLAFALLVVLSGCAAEESGHYTGSQMRAQRADYDPIPHSYGNRY